MGLAFRSRVEASPPVEELDLGRASPYDGYIDMRHPAKANRNLLELLALPYTSPGDVVLDMFAGSGSTGIVAGLLGRKAV